MQDILYSTNSEKLKGETPFKYFLGRAPDSTFSMLLDPMHVEEVVSIDLLHARQFSDFQDLAGAAAQIQKDIPLASH